MVQADFFSGTINLIMLKSCWRIGMSKVNYFLTSNNKSWGLQITAMSLLN